MNAGLVMGDEVPKEYEQLVEPHVASFDYFLNEGMQLAVESLDPVEVRQRGIVLGSTAAYVPTCHEWAYTSWHNPRHDCWC